MTELDVPSLAVTSRTLSPHAESTWRRLIFVRFIGCVARHALYRPGAVPVVFVSLGYRVAARTASHLLSRGLNFFVHLFLLSLWFGAAPSDMHRVPQGQKLVKNYFNVRFSFASGSL